MVALAISTSTYHGVHVEKHSKKFSVEFERSFGVAMYGLRHLFGELHLHSSGVQGRESVAASLPVCKQHKLN